jgi:hypothetical protein
MSLRGFFRNLSYSTAFVLPSFFEADGPFEFGLYVPMCDRSRLTLDDARLA